jgi:Tfp pilus assembly PilM family ATPase
MQDKPDIKDLMLAVQTYLEQQALPQLSGHTGFHGRVAANVLGILHRQLTLAPGFEAAEKARLETLLGKTGTLEGLNRLLCQRIAAGDMGLDNAALMKHLTKTTMGKLAIDQPKYAGYATAQKLGWPEEDTA